VYNFWSGIPEKILRYFLQSPADDYFFMNQLKRYENVFVENDLNILFASKSNTELINLGQNMKFIVFSRRN
jgi:hypothetical protein